MSQERILIEQFRKAKEHAKDLKTRLTEANIELWRIENELLELLTTEEKKSSARYEGLGYVTVIKPQVRASITIEKQEEAFSFLRKQGREDLIKETVHPSSISAYVKSQLEEGLEVPECISYCLITHLKLYKE